nr:hypothetical protein [Vibrio cidicii]
MCSTPRNDPSKPMSRSNHLAHEMTLGTAQRQRFAEVANRAFERREAKRKQMRQKQSVKPQKRGIISLILALFR